MTCKEYIIKRLERAEDDARNIRNAYERSMEKIEDLEDQLAAIADIFKIDGAESEKYVTTKKGLYFESSDKQVFQIIKNWMKVDEEPLPF